MRANAQGVIRVKAITKSKNVIKKRVSLPICFGP